jgi:2-dehydropantoate 2-reductase
MLARAGAPVVLIGRPRHVEAINRNGLVFESGGTRQTLVVSASTDVRDARDADVVLLCVKAPDTEEAARSLAPHLTSSTVLVSLQNGVENVSQVRAAIGVEAVSAVVYVGAEMSAAGHVTHTARGDLVIGYLGRSDQEGARESTPRARGRRLDELASLFVRAGVPCRVSGDVEAELWRKLILNCAYNAVSALSRARYGRVMSQPHTRNLVRQAATEATMVARAAGVALEAADLLEATERLAEAMPETLSSTAQDVGRGKRTEIDALNGYVARRGAELGVATPVNQTLYALVKLLEESSTTPIDLV